MNTEKIKAAGSANPAALDSPLRRKYPNSIQQPWQDVETEFRWVLRNAGLGTEDTLLFDGKLHRFHILGDRPNSKNGWYVVFRFPFPVGAFGCWKRGFSQTWCLRDRSFTSIQDRYLIREQFRKAQALRELEENEHKQQAQQRASALWQKATPALDTHPYLLQKRIRAHSIRVLGNSLVIPLQDAEGILRSLQFIDPNGTKHFLAGGRKAGCYFSIRDFSHEKLLIAEGYATGASLFEATGFPVAVAFDAGNLKSVAIALRKKFPQKELIICADNDFTTMGNPGLTKAKEAARLVNGKLTYPSFDGGRK